MKLLALLMLTLFVVPARADSLDALVATALDKNPEVLAARKKWEASRHKIPQARAFEDPMIGVDIERSDTTRLDTFSDNEWMVSQKLPWFGKRGARASVATLAAEAAGFQYLDVIRDVRARVRTAAAGLWLSQKTVEVTRQNKSLSQQIEEIARSRYEAGQASQADVLRAQVELSKLGNELVAMEREVTVAQSALNTLLDAPRESARVVESLELPATEIFSSEQLLAGAQRYNAKLLAMGRQTQAKEAAVRVAKLEAAPDVEFRVEARQFNGKSGIQEYDTGVFLNFPWLWHGKYDAMRREAKADAEMAAADYQSEWNKTRQMVEELRARAETAQRQMKLYETTVLPQAKQLLDATRNAYQTGHATFLELMDARRALSDFQLDFYKANAEYAKQRALMDQITAPFGRLEGESGLVAKEKK